MVSNSFVFLGHCVHFFSLFLSPNNNQKNNTDILVNNAGVAILAMLTGSDETYESAWKFNFAVNVTAQVCFICFVLFNLYIYIYIYIYLFICSLRGLDWVYSFMFFRLIAVTVLFHYMCPG